MKDNLTLYFIYLIHLITLSISVHFESLLKNFYNIKISFHDINIYLFKYFRFTINHGNINIISLIYFILFFFIGLKNNDNKLIHIVLSFLIIEFPIFYFENKSNILINLSISILGYIFGRYFNNRNYNNIIAKNKIETDEDHNLETNYEILDNQYSGI